MLCLLVQSDASSETPLHTACLYDSAEVAKLLLDARADPNGVAGPPKVQRVPLSTAVHRGNPEIVKYLLEAKANPNMWGDSWLVRACLYGLRFWLRLYVQESMRGQEKRDFDSFFMLLDAKADPNLPRLGMVTLFFTFKIKTLMCVVFVFRTWTLC